MHNTRENVYLSSFSDTYHMDVGVSKYVFIISHSYSHDNEQIELLYHENGVHIDIQKHQCIYTTREKMIILPYFRHKSHDVLNIRAEIS